MPTGQTSKFLRQAVLMLDAAGMTDGQLLARFLERRDEAAFEALLRRHGRMVLGVCRRILGNSHDAEDAFQAVFLVFVRKAASLASREALGGWLYGVAYRTALEARGKISRRRAREKQVQDMPQPTARPETVWQQLQPLLDQELNRLPDKYRVPVVLCDLEGRTRKEAARQLGIPEGTLSSRLATARKRLAKRLSRHGLGISAGALAAALSQNGTAPACLSASLVVSTTKAALLVATGQAAAAGVISAHVAALTGGVLKTMLLTKLKTITAVVLAVIASASVGGLLSYQMAAAGQAKTGSEAQGISARTEEDARVAPPGEVVPNRDREELQGRWLLVAQEYDGRRQEYPRGSGVLVGFRGNKYMAYEAGKVHLLGVPQAGKGPRFSRLLYELDSTRKPAAIDLMSGEDPKERNDDLLFMQGPLKAKAWRGTYLLERRGIYALAGDNLQICWNLAGNDRPDKFGTAPDSGLVLQFFKRVPPDVEADDLKGEAADRESNEPRRRTAGIGDAPQKQAVRGKQAEQRKELVKFLVTAFKDDHEAIRTTAANALANLGRGAVRDLIELLEGPDPKLRRAAIQYLSTLSNVPEETLPVLARLFKDEKVLAEALKPKGNSLPILRLAPMVLGTDRVPVLVELLKGDDLWLRVQALDILGRMGEQASEAIPALTRMYKNEKDPEERRRILEAISKIVPSGWRRPPGKE